MHNSEGPQIKLFIPDETDAGDALARCTHLGIGAHQDDLEFMAFHGIAECYDSDEDWFGGITCTNGAGSARSGPYANFSDAEMAAVRIEEQEAAARIGRYSFVAQLGHTSAEIKDGAGFDVLVETLADYLQRTAPSVVYTHNPADRHATHVSVFKAVIAAMRQIPAEQRPKEVYGCEVWRDLDWLDDGDKVALNVSRHPELAKELNACFTSQTAGGKNYGDAVIGRRRANATFHQSHAVDDADQLWFAMDLKPLVDDPSIVISDWVDEKLGRFRRSVADALRGEA